MNTDHLLPIIVKSIVDSALESRGAYAGMADGTVRWEVNEGPLVDPLRRLCTELAQDPDFRAMLIEEMRKPERIAMCADAIVKAMSEKAVKIKHDYRGERVVTLDPALAEAVKDVLVEQLRARPDLLGDRVDADMLRACNLSVTITSKS